MSPGHDLPIVRLTVENMRHHILAALGPHLDGLKEATAAAVNDVVRDFEPGGLVRREVQLAIQEQIRRTVAGIVEKAFDSPEMRRALEAAIGEGLRAYFERWEGGAR